MIGRVSKLFKKFFRFFSISKQEIISSVGLIFIKDFIAKSLVVELFSNIRDNRDPLKIWYSMSEQLVGIILRILGGDIPFYHFQGEKNSAFLKRVYNICKEPHFTTFRYLFKTNPHLVYALENILFQLGIDYLKKAICKYNLKRITLDIDQTDRENYGKQEGVKKGYSAKGKNKRVYQGAVWIIRELNYILKVELLPGNTHCSNNFLERLKPVTEELKNLKIKILVCCDSGYANQAIFDYLNQNRIEFIFAKKQNKAVKQRGKNAKNKSYLQNGGIVIKERICKTKNDSKYREIFIQNKIVVDNDGQLYFKNFASNQFTNVLITNLDNKAKHVYKKYREHAIIEKVIEELKNEFGFAKAHGSSFNFNSSLAQLVAIAYNIKVSFLREKAETEVNKFLLNIKICKLSTFQRTFIHLPGILVNHSGKMILKLPECILPFFKSTLLNLNYSFKSS